LKLEGPKIEAEKLKAEIMLKAEIGGGIFREGAQLWVTGTFVLTYFI